MSSVRSANTARNVRTILDTTQASWLCSATPARTKDEEELAIASTTAPEAHAVPQAISLHPNDPYPTWPFTRVNPADLERWCKRNLPNKQWPQGDIEEALI